MRLFVAFDIDENIRKQITPYMQRLQNFAPETCWVAPESLHVTLKFIGERPKEEITRIQDALSAIQVKPIGIAFRGYGFFPTVRAARVFWLGIEADAGLAKLVSDVDTVLATLGISREEHAFTPHLTLARSGSGAPLLGSKDKSNSRFQRLQEKLSAMPLADFGTMTAHEFSLYESKLLPRGSRYAKLARFALQD
jgi:RNA 2',3'-cyclic 3'-phosphodiesterase